MTLYPLHIAARKAVNLMPRPTVAVDVAPYPPRPVSALSAAMALHRVMVINHGIPVYKSFNRAVVKSLTVKGSTPANLVYGFRGTDSDAVSRTITAVLTKDQPISVSVSHSPTVSQTIAAMHPVGKQPRLTKPQGALLDALERTESGVMAVAYSPALLASAKALAAKGRIALCLVRGTGNDRAICLRGNLCWLPPISDAFAYGPTIPQHDIVGLA